MEIVIHHGKEEPAPWAERHFGEAEFSDVRRVRRVQMIAEAMAAQPGQSLPELFGRWYDVKAAYMFFKQEEAIPDNIQAGHREYVLAAMEKPGEYLLLEDTSEMVWAGQEPKRGLGPVGNSKKVGDGLQGFHLHSVLAVGWPEVCPAESAPEGEGPLEGERPPVQILGLADQQYRVRRPRPAGEPRNDSQARKKRNRESQVWEQASYRVGPAPAEPTVRWVSVADRGADIYEYLRSKQELGHGFVVRASQDRVVLDPATGNRLGYLFAVAGQAPSLGSFDLELRARPGQAARTARLSLAATPVRLRAPQRPGVMAGTHPPIDCTVVRVWEAAPPGGGDGLEWILLCDRPVRTLNEALAEALKYSARWILEEYHKALKTGMQAEALQLETGKGLMAAIAIMSVVALRLIDLRERLRVHPEAPAETSGLSRLELEILHRVLRRPMTTVRDVALGIGRLGGHLNRTHDGMPGWITLWRGMTKLRLLVTGVRLASKMKRFG